MSANGARENHGRGMLGVTEFVLGEMDLKIALDTVVEEARRLTGARYAALCVLNDARDGLARFITAGIENDSHATIGALPRGRGVLGDLILDPVPLRIANLAEHQHSYGFPIGHPPMRSFLGVPIVVDHVSCGSLYLTEKAGGAPFTDQDQERVVRLARRTGLAIDHARREPGNGTV